MSKYTFTCEYVDFTGKPDGSKITLEVREDSLMNVVEAFERFLKGSGFIFDGHLDFVNDEDMSCEEEDEPHEWIQDKMADREWPFPERVELYDSQDVMEAPGTMGGARVVLPSEKCKRCGLTTRQLGESKCYDDDCGLKP